MKQNPDDLKEANPVDPSQGGRNPFSDFLRAAAADREFRVLSKQQQTHIGRALLSNATYSNECLGTKLSVAAPRRALP